MKNYMISVICVKLSRSTQIKRSWTQVFGVVSSYYAIKPLKNEADVAPLKKVCSAILGDGRQRKKRADLAKLKTIIDSNIDFFISVHPIIESKEKKQNQAIDDYIDQLSANATSQEEVDNAFDKTSDLRSIYTKYKKVYNELNQVLRENEIICFFRKAAENIDTPIVTVSVNPDGRPLTFLKMVAWSAEGNEMRIAH
jgi:hypothetical protein